MTPRLRIWAPRPHSLLLLCLCGLTSLASAAPPDHWVGTWGSSPVLTPNTNGRIVSGDTTLREIVHISLGGSTARVVLSNEFGLDPLTVGAAGCRRFSAGDDSIVPRRRARSHSAVAPPRSFRLARWSSAIPVAIKLPALADVAVSLFIPDQPIQQLSAHSFADQTNYSAMGNVVSVEKLDMLPRPISRGRSSKASTSRAAPTTVLS